MMKRFLMQGVLRNLISAGYTLFITYNVGKLFIHIANARREYPAIGGEILVVLAVYIVSWKFINSLFDSWEDLKNEGKRKKRRGRRTARIQNNR